MLENIIQRPTFKLPLQTTIEGVRTQIGDPIAESVLDQFYILQYTAASSSRADYLYFEEGVLVKKSLSLSIDEKTITDFISLFGEPTVSRSSYSAEVSDSLQLTVHVWPEQGISAISNGAEKDSLVMRAEEFSPLSLAEYYQKWEPRLATNPQVTIQAVPYQERLLQQYQQAAKPSAWWQSENGILIMGGVVLVSTVLIFSALAFTMKKRKKIKKLAHTLEKK